MSTELQIDASRTPAHIIPKKNRILTAGTPAGGERLEAGPGTGAHARRRGDPDAAEAPLPLQGGTMFLDPKTDPLVTTPRAVGNGTADDRPAFAYLDGLTPKGTIYVPPGTYRISNSGGTTFTLNSDIRFQQGAVLKPDAGVTIELLGRVDAGTFQIFDVSNTGAHAYPRRELQVIPQWWGAKGDWLNDDYPAIAAALDTVRVTAVGATGTGGTVYFPKGIYRVTHPLDCTIGFYHLAGAGPLLSILRGDTGPGRAVIEFLGSQFCTVEGLQIDTTSVANPPQGTPTATPSTVGVLLGRVTAADTGQPNQSWFVNLRECLIRMQHNMDANGGHGTVGVYNYGCEISNVHDVYVEADVPVVYTSENVVFGLTSYHRPANGAFPMINVGTSMTVVNATGGNGFFAWGGPAVRVSGAAAVHLSAHLARELTVAQGGNVAAVEVSNSLTDFEHRGTIEVFQQMLRTISSIRGARLYASMDYSLDYPLIHLAEDPAHAGIPQIMDSIVNIVPRPGPSFVGTPPPVETYLVDSDAGWPAEVSGSLLFLYRGKVRIANAFPESAFNGNVVLSKGALTNASITSGNRNGNALVDESDKDSIDDVLVGDVTVNGVRLDTGKVGVGNSAAGSVLGTVVKKVEIFNAAGTSLGFVPVYNTIT
jgi:hypothetical protein